MAYFLGYSDYGSYKPIVLHDRNNKKIENKILDVVHFTNSFGCENDLRNYLIERNLIPYHHSELAYLIDKGPKGNKKYEPIKMGNVLYLMDSQTFFTPGGIRYYCSSNKYDVDFICHLYSFYLKKLGLFNQMKNKLSSIAENPLSLKSYLTSLLNRGMSKAVEDRINVIIDLINSTYVQEFNYYRFFTEKEQICYMNLIDEFYYSLSDSDTDLIHLYNILSKSITFPNIPVIRNIKNIYSVALRVEEIGLDNYQNSYDEYQDIESLWERFIYSIIYTFDPKTKKYKEVDGTKKIQERNLVDLGMFLYGYYQYQMKYLEPVTRYDDEEEIEDDYEEFLEEEDFARYNTTSEDAGYRLKKSDSEVGW